MSLNRNNYKINKKSYGSFLEQKKRGGFKQNVNVSIKK